MLCRVRFLTQDEKAVREMCASQIAKSTMLLSQDKLDSVRFRKAVCTTSQHNTVRIFDFTLRIVCAYANMLRSFPFVGGIKSGKVGRRYRLLPCGP